VLVVDTGSGLVATAMQDSEPHPADLIAALPEEILASRPEELYLEDFATIANIA
jgi:hypothetical protein